MKYYNFTTDRPKRPVKSLRKASHEVSEYGFFAEDKLPLLRKNQVILIDAALKLHR